MSINSMSGLDYEIEMMEAYEKLKNKNQDHKLLEIAIVREDNFLHPTEEFWKKYPQGSCAIGSYILYTKDLKCASGRCNKEK